MAPERAAAPLVCGRRRRTGARPRPVCPGPQVVVAAAGLVPACAGEPCRGVHARDFLAAADALAAPVAQFTKRKGGASGRGRCRRPHEDSRHGALAEVQREGTGQKRMCGASG
jgi:hypothetical protein